MPWEHVKTNLDNDPIEKKSRDQQDAEKQKAISIERKILEKLGNHPRIVPYLGDYDNGILLPEASHGSLQDYINANHANMPTSQRWDFYEHLTEAIVHIHSHGVIHSDMRPENVLVHQVVPLPVSLWLTDFGGSVCEELRLDGGHLPDSGFFDPRRPWTSTPSTDIFSLGSIFYVIATGRWPHMDGPLDRSLGHFEYEKRVDALFKQGIFPPTSGLDGGDVIQGCWDHKYSTAEELLQAVRLGKAAAGA